MSFGRSLRSATRVAELTPIKLQEPFSSPVSLEDETETSSTCSTCSRDSEFDVWSETSSASTIDESYNELCAAVRNGKLKVLSKLLTSNANINMTYQVEVKFI